MRPSKIKVDEEKSKHVILTILHPKYFVQAILLLLLEMLLARTTLLLALPPREGKRLAIHVRFGMKFWLELRTNLWVMMG
jgi:hypothetical protein